MWSMPWSSSSRLVRSPLRSSLSMQGATSGQPLAMSCSGVDVMPCFIIEDLRLVVSIGATPEERQAPQEIRIDAIVDLSDDHPPGEDDLASTLDYDLIVSTLRELAISRHHELQETLAHRMLDAMMGIEGVIGARIETRKQAYEDMRWVGYRCETGAGSGI